MAIYQENHSENPASFCGIYTFSINNDLLISMDLLI